MLNLQSKCVKDKPKKNICCLCYITGQRNIHVGKLLHSPLFMYMGFLCHVYLSSSCKDLIRFLLAPDQMPNSQPFYGQGRLEPYISTIIFWFILAIKLAISKRTPDRVYECGPSPHYLSASAHGWPVSNWLITTIRVQWWILNVSWCWVVISTTLTNSTELTKHACGSTHSDYLKHR